MTMIFWSKDKHSDIQSHYSDCQQQSLLSTCMQAKQSWKTLRPDNAMVDLSNVELYGDCFSKKLVVVKLL